MANPSRRRKLAIISALIYAAIIAAVFLIARVLIGGPGSRTVALVHDADGEEHVLPFIHELQNMGCRVNSLDMAKPITNCVSATMLLNVPHRCDHFKMMEEMRLMPGVVFAESV